MRTFSSSNTAESSSINALKEFDGVITSTSEGRTLSLLYIIYESLCSKIIVLPLPATPCKTNSSPSGRVIISNCFS